MKYLSNFWRTLDMPLINYEVSLILAWSEKCVLTSITYRRAVTGDNPVSGIKNTTGATFKIKDTIFYVPVVILSTENDNNLLDQLKTGFKGTIKLNKCRSEMSNQTRNNNLNYLIDPTFTKVNKVFVLSFENEEDRSSFSKYYISKIEIKDFNVLFDGNQFFEYLQKNKEEAYEQIIDMCRNNDYTTGDLLDYYISSVLGYNLHNHKCY